jgi:hypothetical protein
MERSRASTIPFTQSIDASPKGSAISGGEKLVPVTDHRNGEACDRAAISRLGVQNMDSCGRRSHELTPALPKPRALRWPAGQVDSGKCKRGSNLRDGGGFIVEEIMYVDAVTREFATQFA